MSKLFRYTTIALVVISIPVLLFVVVASFFISPGPALVSHLLAAVFIAVVLLALRQTPIWPPKIGSRGQSSTSVWWILCALLWGAGVSFLVVMVAAFPALDVAVSLRWEESMASFGGAWPEEPAKALGVLFILMSFRRFSRPWHGFLVGMVVGLGFEAVENASYGTMGGMMHASSDMLGMLQTWGARLVMGPLLHVGFTGLAGWGIGLALYVVGRSLAWRIQAVTVYFIAALALHFGWNYSQESTAAYLVQFALVALVFYGLWIYVWVRAVRAARADDTYVHAPRALTSVGQLRAMQAPQNPAVPAEFPLERKRRSDEVMK